MLLIRSYHIFSAFPMMKDFIINRGPIVFPYYYLSCLIDYVELMYLQ